MELYAPHMFKHKFTHEGTHYTKGREDRWHRQSQTPRANESYDKTSEEPGEEGNDESHFFWDTLLDKICELFKYVQVRT